MFVYGPFQHWAFGLCIGLNVIGDKRICPLDCIYCPYPVTRADCSPNLNEIVKELENAYDKFSTLTKSLLISGHGDPLLCDRLSFMLNYIRDIFSLKVILRTTYISICTLHIPKDILSSVDHIVVKLDAITPETITSINKPSVKLPPDVIKSRMITLSQEIPIFIEVNIIRTSSNKLNSDSTELRKLIETIIDIAPDGVLLQSFPGFSNAQKLAIGELIEIGRIFADYLGWHRVKIRGFSPLSTINLSLDEGKNAIISTLDNFPLTREEMASILSYNNVEEVIRDILRIPNVVVLNGYFMKKR